VIDRQVRHLTRLVDDLLDVSRITRGKIALDREPLELAAVVARAVEMAGPLLEQRRQTLTLQVPYEGLPVDGDPVRLAQVVSNLLTNAAKYSEPGGRIAVVGRRDGAEVVLECRDTGIGISAEMLPRVFELFAQGHRAPDRVQGGLGLGLALARSLTVLHGGRISARSPGPGCGSTFEVRLPALRARSAQPRRRVVQSRPPAAAGSASVLVVDDNADAAEMLARALADAGHSVTVAHDPVDALDKARSLVPDAAVLDVGLPVMDGYELASQLRAVSRGRPLRLVALTGYGQNKDRARSREAGFHAHLVKPVDIPVLLAALAGDGDPRQGL